MPHIKFMNDKALPCPFCGKSIDVSDYDTMYPTNTVWAYDESIGCRVYFSAQAGLPHDGECWQIRCDLSAGGCDAEIHGDSREEALMKWNRRTKPQH